MFTTEYEERADGPQAHELPRALRTCSACSAAPTASCPSATPSPACCTAASRPARCTASCACATSSRTTPTSSAREEQVEDEVLGLPGLRLRAGTEQFGFEIEAELVDAAREPARHGRVLGRDGGRCCARRSTTTGLAVRGRRGRRRVLRAQDRPARDATRSAARGSSGTVQLDYNLPERFGLTYTGADNAEHRPVMIHRALLGLLRALHRHPDRGHARASCRSGWRPCRRRSCRSPTATTTYAQAVAQAPRGRRPARDARRAHGVRSGARSATRSCRRCRSCSSSATARPRRRAVAVRRHGEGDRGTHAARGGARALRAEMRDGGPRGVRADHGRRRVRRARRPAARPRRRRRPAHRRAPPQLVRQGAGRRARHPGRLRHRPRPSAAASDDGVAAATVSLTTDFLGGVEAGDWIDRPHARSSAWAARWPSWTAPCAAASARSCAGARCSPCSAEAGVTARTAGRRAADRRRATPAGRRSAWRVASEPIDATRSSRREVREISQPVAACGARRAARG